MKPKLYIVASLIALVVGLALVSKAGDAFREFAQTQQTEFNAVAEELSR